MKKLHHIIMAVVVLCAASCQKISQNGQAEEATSVTFTVDLPYNIDTKGISDGEKALKLFYATYSDKGQFIPSASNITVGETLSNKQAQVTIKLVKHLTYDIVFWAQAETCDAFTLDWTNAVMTVDYEGSANDDYRDAFYALKENVVITGAPYEDEVKLYRPFAQINFGASDYNSVTEYYSETLVDAGMQSSFACLSVPDALNLLDGTLGTSTAEAKFALTVIPSDPKELEVKGEKYRYVSMNYVLAPKGTQPDNLTEISATFKYADGNIDRTVTVPNVPILRNHRTNILGDFFTENVMVKVIVDNEFTKPDNDVPYPAI